MQSSRRFQKKKGEAKVHSFNLELSYHINRVQITGGVAPISWCKGMRGRAGRMGNSPRKASKSPGDDKNAGNERSGRRKNGEQSTGNANATKIELQQVGLHGQIDLLTHVPLLREVLPLIDDTFSINKHRRLRINLLQEHNTIDEIFAALDLEQQTKCKNQSSILLFCRLVLSFPKSYSFLSFSIFRY